MPGPPISCEFNLGPVEFETLLGYAGSDVLQEAVNIGIELVHHRSTLQETNREPMRRGDDMAPRPQLGG